MKRLLTSIMMLLSVMIVQAQQVVHTVQRGETLESIAQKYHVTKEAITKNNPYAADAFYVGLKLYIPTAQSEDIQQNTGQSQNEAIQPAPYNGNNDYSQNKQSEYSYSNDSNSSTSTSTFNPQKQMGMEIYAGGNYRYHITEYIYLEGRIFAGYYQWDTKFNKVKGYSIDDIKVREAFLGISPRAGLRYKKVAISAGYRWDWVKFKFKKENCLDRFNIGLTFFL